MSFELAWPHRNHRVRFKKAVRVVPLVDGPPRAYRVLSGNLSKQGMFLAMPEPFPEGTQVALSLEAGGRVLPFAQGEVMWRQPTDAVHDGGKPVVGGGFGVRFTNFLHPRAHELVDYLVGNLDTGRPLALPKQKKWKRMALWAGGFAASAMLASFGVMLARNVTMHSAPPPAAHEEVVAAAPALPEPAPLPEPVAVAAPAPEPVVVAAPAPAPAPEPLKAEPVIHAPVVRDEPVMVATQPAAAAREPSLSSTGLLPLPKCGASSLRWSQRGERLELEVAPAAGARFAAGFRLKNPERLVIDLSGVSPKRSHVVKASEIPNVTALRIGKRKGGGTRLVLDLAKGATLKVDGSRLQLSY